MDKKLSFYSTVFGFRVEVHPGCGMSWLRCEVEARGMTLGTVQFGAHNTEYPALRLIFDEKNVGPMFLLACELTAMKRQPRIFIGHNWGVGVTRVEFSIRYPTLRFVNALLGHPQPEGGYAIAAGRYGLIVSFEASIPWEDMCGFFNHAKSKGFFLCRVEQGDTLRAWQWHINQVFPLPENAFW